MTQAVTLAQAGNSNGTFRNKLINGDMRIDQRNAGTSVTPGATFGYQLDRWTYGTSVASKISVQQVADAPAGFYNSLKLTSLSAYSIAAGDRFILGQCIEGYNTTDIGWGTANAQTVTVSFWVKSSLTGTFACSFNNTAGSYSYVTTYTISSANTWEKKIVTIPGVTSGAWNTGTNAGSIWVVFDIGTGSTYQTGTLNTWQNAFYENATGVVALPATNGATWQVTGVQFELGTQATTFETRSYSKELLMCQRYYEKSWAQGTPVGSSSTGVQLAFRSYNQSTTFAIITGTFKVTKRTNSPTMVGYDSNGRAGKCNINDSITDPNNITLTGCNPFGDSSFSAQLNYSPNFNGYSLAWSADAEL